MKTCPYCEAEIANNAKKCRYCGEIVVEEKKARLCPYCESELSETARKCKHCGERVEEPEELEKNEIEIKKETTVNKNALSPIEKKGLMKASGFRYFCAQFLDFLIARIPVLGLSNVFYMRALGTSIGYDIFGLIALNEKGEKLTNKQRCIFTFTYFPNLFHLTYYIPILFLGELFIRNDGLESLEPIVMLIFFVTCITGFINMILGLFSQENTLEGKGGIRKFAKILPTRIKVRNFFISCLYCCLIAAFGNVMFTRQLPYHLYQGDFSFYEIGRGLEGFGAFLLGVGLTGLAITIIASRCLKDLEKNNVYKYNRDLKRYLTSIGITIGVIILFRIARIEFHL